MILSCSPISRPQVCVVWKHAFIYMYVYISLCTVCMYVCIYACVALEAASSDLEVSGGRHLHIVWRPLLERGRVWVPIVIWSTWPDLIFYIPHSYHAIPNLTVPGGALIGCSAGFLNGLKIKVIQVYAQYICMYLCMYVFMCNEIYVCMFVCRGVTRLWNPVWSPRRSYSPPWERIRLG